MTVNRSSVGSNSMPSSASFSASEAGQAPAYAVTGSAGSASSTTSAWEETTCVAPAYSETSPVTSTWSPGSTVMLPEPWGK